MGTWLTLPDPPMKPPKAVLMTLLAPTDGPAAEPVPGSGATTCGGAATDSISGSALLELPDLPRNADNAALTAMRVGPVSEPVPGSGAAMVDGAATADTPRRTW